MEKQLGVGIIGCGAIFSKHLNAIKTLDYKELLLDEEVEVVHILTPHYLHVQMAIESLQAGKHVVLEKPVGISIKGLKKLRRIAKESNKTIGVTFQNRFNPSALKMKSLVEEGVLGELKSSKGLVIWGRTKDYYSYSDWRGKLAYEGGGVLINQAIHTLDLLQYIGGKVKGIEGLVANHNHPDIEVEDTALATLHYENGGTGSFFATNNYGANANIELEFIFEKGKLRLLDNQLYMTIDEEEKVIASDGSQKGAKNYWGKGHIDCITNIYTSIIEGVEPMISLEDAINATKLVLGIYESSKNKEAYWM